MTDETAQEEPPAEPAPEPAWACLAELPGGELVKFTDHQAALSHPAVPSGARIWISRSHFIGNSDPADHQELYASLREPEPENPEELSDVNSAPAWKGRLFDALLARAWTPEQASIHLGVRDKESKMARKNGDGVAADKKPRGEKKARAPRAEGEARSRVSKDATIKLLAAENPKRKGSAAFDRFKLYRDGMTVGDFLKKGGKTIDLGYDVKAGHISLNG